jgi:hypothetical protein
MCIRQMNKESLLVLQHLERQIQIGVPMQNMGRGCGQKVGQVIRRIQDAVYIL